MCLSSGNVMLKVLFVKAHRFIPTVGNMSRFDGQGYPIVRLWVTGAPGVGKTELIRRWQPDSQQFTAPVVGMEFATSYPALGCKVIVWDDTDTYSRFDGSISGRRKYRPARPTHYYHHTAAILFCYDCQEAASQGIASAPRELKGILFEGATVCAPSYCTCYLVGTKSDLLAPDTVRDVSTAVQKFVEEFYESWYAKQDYGDERLSFQFTTVSAHGDASGTEDLFTRIITKAVKDVHGVQPSRRGSVLLPMHSQSILAKTHHPARWAKCAC